MLTILKAADELTVLLSGEIDHHSAAKLREEIDASIEMERPKTLNLDFGGVTFMDSSGIGLVMGRYKLMQTMDGGIALKNVPNPLKPVMRIAGLEALTKKECKKEISDEADKHDETFL